MFKFEVKLPDPLLDDVGDRIRELQTRDSWGKREQDLKAQLVRLLKRRGYIDFWGQPARYHLSRIGEACMYDVPNNRRGLLKEFRGKRIRLVCVGSGRYYRAYMAGTVRENPTERSGSACCA